MNQSLLLPIGLDLDGSLQSQPATLARLHHLADLRDLSDGLRLSASETAINQLRIRLAALQEQFPQPWLTFIGSGDFHHIALSILESLPQSIQPFTLVSIDNHPDWFFEKPTHHCGNWISGALSVAKRIVLIGADSPDLKWYRFYPAPFDELCDGRVQFHPLRFAQVRLPLKYGGPERKWWGSRLRFRTLQSVGASALFNEIAEQLAETNIYLTIDKDVLHPADAATDWEQGGLTLDELAAGVRVLNNRCRIIGADICGERATEPLVGFAKRLDAGRLWKKFRPPTDSEIRLNELANLALLSVLVPSPGVPGEVAT